MATDEYWKIKNTALIEEMQDVPEKELVDRLWTEDSKAWEYIYLRSVIPVLKQPKYFHIMHDRNLSSIDIYGMVYEHLIAKKKLALFGFRCPVIYWIRYCVGRLILHYLKKNPWAVSDDDYLLGLNNKPARESSGEDSEVARRCFAKLWRQNPMRAYVHLLKVRNEMSAKDIMSLLDISSESNVNKIYERAMSDMKCFRNEFSCGGKNELS